MVRKIEREKANYGKKTLYRRRLSVDDLLNLFEKNQNFGISGLTAYNLEYEFEDIEDMRSNKQLLVGNPIFKLGKFTIDFGFRKMVVSSGYHSMSSEEDAAFKRLLVELRHYRDPLGFLAFFEDSYFFLLVPFLATFIPGIDRGLSSINANYFEYFSIFLLMLLVATGIGRLYFWKSDSVFLKSTEGFIKKHIGGLVIGTLSAAFGAVAGALAIKWMSG